MDNKKICFIVIALLLSAINGLHAQPFYFYTNIYGTEIWRVNLQTGIKDLFYQDSTNWGEVTVDPSQQWVYFWYGKGGNRPLTDYWNVVDVVKSDNPAIKHTFPDSGSFVDYPASPSYRKKRVHDGVVFDKPADIFYVIWTNAHDSLGWYDRDLRIGVYNASTFALLDSFSIPEQWLASTSSVSEDGSKFYVERWQNQSEEEIGIFSVQDKNIIKRKNFWDIVVPTQFKVLLDNKNGRFLIGYIYPDNDIQNGKYAVYDIEKDTATPSITFPRVSDGYLSGDTKYVVLEETPFNPNFTTVNDEYFHPGRISIFETSTGKLQQKLALPANGKIVIANDYPNMFYYYLSKKSQSINIDLTKLAAIGALGPQNVLVGSGAFTLSVAGKNFTTESKVQLNGANRATTFIADTLLQATIRAADVDTATTAYIAVKDSLAPSANVTTDSLALNVVSISQQSLLPVLDCVTQTNDTTYTAWFGYENDDTTSIFVPVGPQNKFSPTPNDRTQPTIFSTGRQDKIFSLVFNGKNLTWKLNGNEVVASKKSPKCN